ncbi:hypothetical protein TRICI_002587 [Trichomonascus ciferrii]|uniref:Uncharacterized protein n=1 Tax=Trichomonascus ciferrii TaxID=44093 RepID=A0A642V5F8_9ASCO|nr:hypothetical protein TRICI_002587 [Trichomonascus ciferrii]
MGRGIGTFPLDMLGLLTPPQFAPGTGIIPMTQNATEVFEVVPDIITKRVVTQMNGLFGDYPNETDIAPSGLFIGLFGIIAGGHLMIFTRNVIRGHNFYLSLGLAFYALCRMIGFGLRVKWAKNVLDIKTGIASTVFCQVPVLLLNVMCMFMAHRIFTWRHPQLGSSVWFRVINWTLYLLVLGVIVMAILGTSLPYIYYMTESDFHQCQKAAQTAGVLEAMYAFSGNFVIILAWSLKPGVFDDQLKSVKSRHPEFYPATLQPYWIDHFRPFYYIKPEERKTAHYPVISVMPSREKPANGLSRPHNPHRSDHPSIYTAIAIVSISSCVLTFNCCFRVASLFIIRPRGGYGAPFGHFSYHAITFYVLYGALELLVNVALMLSRVDLRFYVPDTESVFSTKGVKDHLHAPGEEDEFVRGKEYKDDFSPEEKQEKSHQIQQYEYAIPEEKQLKEKPAEMHGIRDIS